jgi:thiol-disulfide isomerase/thioredoxin
MRDYPLRIFICLAVACGGAMSAMAQATNDNNAHSLVLKASDANGDWEELLNAQSPPPGPKEWQAAPPSPQQKEKYYMPFVKAAADKARDFYQNHPKDRRVGTARLLEARSLYLMLDWGDTSEEARFNAVEKAVLADSSVSENERARMLEQMSQSLPPEKVRPFLDEVVAGQGSKEFKGAAQELLGKMKALGQPMALQFTAVDGRPVDLTQFKGKVVLIDFWATWCGPCRGEIPDVKKTYEKYHSKGFEIVGISLDQDKSTLTNFVAENKMDWPQFFDGQGWGNKYARQYDVNAIPAMWLVDKKGILRDMNAREDLSGNVEKLLAE